MSVVSSRRCFAADATELHSLLAISLQSLLHRLLTRSVGSTMIHKQSRGHPWPSQDPDHTGLVLCQVSSGCHGETYKVQERCDVPLVLIIRPALQPLHWYVVRLKTFLRSRTAGEPAASSIQHGSVRPRPFVQKRGRICSRSTFQKASKFK